MALRLPMLTMMVLCAILLPQPSLEAQQSITSRRTNAPVLKAATRQTQNPSVGMSTAVNPLRFAGLPSSAAAITDSTPDPIPANVAQAIYPSRRSASASSNTLPPSPNNASEQTQNANAGQQIQTVPGSRETGSRQQTGSVKQAAYIEAAYIEPVSYAQPTAPRANNSNVGHAMSHTPPPNVEPAKAEMTADFSRMPPREVVAESELQAQVEAMLNQSASRKMRTDGKETVGSLLSGSLNSRPSSFESNTELANELPGDSSASLGFEKDGSEQDSESITSQQFKKLLEKVVASTVYVLIFAVGFIFVAKRWVKKKVKPTAGAHSSRAVPDIKVVSSLRLQAKSNLQLVEVGQERVLVASDATGIKSVVSLGSPFSSAFESYEEPEATQSTYEAPSEAPSPLLQPSQFSQQPITRFESSLANPSPVSMPSSTDAELNSNGQTNTGHVEPPRRVSLSERVRAYAQSEVKPESVPDTDVEAEMKRKLAELLGGEAFKDVFYKANQSRRS